MRRTCLDIHLEIRDILYNEVQLKGTGIMLNLYVVFGKYLEITSFETALLLLKGVSVFSSSFQIFHSSTPRRLQSKLASQKYLMFFVIAAVQIL